LTPWVRRPPQYEYRQYAEDESDEECLKTGRCLGPRYIDQNDHRSEDESHRPRREMFKQVQVGAKPDQSECGFEDHGEPDAKTREGPHQRPHCSVYVEVGATRLGHCGCHLGLR